MVKNTFLNYSKPFIIAEAGINHNGDIKIAEKLIDAAVDSGCDYIKFQKRNPDICVPEKQKSRSDLVIFQLPQVCQKNKQT